MASKDNDNNKYNNIIYYDSNIHFLSNINYDINDFEKVISGAFIVCTNMDSFNLIREELLFEIEKGKRLTFNLITTGCQCDNVMRFLEEDPKFKRCIAHICVYCSDIQKWDQLKSKYDLIYDFASSKEGIINYIKNFSSKEIEPYHIKKVITLDDYLEEYKDKHIKISQFYGDLTPQTFNDNIVKMKSLIEEENKANKLIARSQNIIFEGFLTFNLDQNLIIREYTNNSIYADLNRWLRNPNFKSFDVVAYFAARLMYSLNNYANQEGKYYNLDKTVLFGGMKLPYSDILPYERAKGKIIVSSTFTSTYQEIKIAERFAGRKDTKYLYKVKKKFSVIFIIKNNLKKNWISNGIRIADISCYKREKEVLYQPFSFYYVRDIMIDLENYKADIYLETIGKKEILEEKIIFGKEIKYNEQEKILEVK